MPGVKKDKQASLQLLWQQTLSDYITSLVWFPDGAASVPPNSLIASSAAGEVAFYRHHPQTKTPSPDSILLQAATGQSIDCLAISHDGQFIAAGGQNGEVKIWQMQTGEPILVATLANAPAWVDQMAWNPKQNLLAFSLGRYVQVWDAEIGEVAATLNFENSSVLDITWHPDGDRLTVAGYQGVKVWSTQDWDEDPYFVEIPSASAIIAWSPEGKYIASGNLDRTISVIEWENPTIPWVMRGFSGKIRQLVWTDTAQKRGAPLLASSSSQSIVVWEKDPDELIGWNGHVLGEHDDRVQAMQFQPGTATLASAGADGWIVIWQKAARIGQMVEGAPAGFSCLAWHPKGRQLAAGGQSGEVLVWASIVRAQGFGQK
ncbi:MAG: hypothetical protein HC827_21025 [Cyanobacteria bacterium RM1_2_2]|nr:hypothetical protein [Cyanobacteria bacterium RM1_2_2]